MTEYEKMVRVNNVRYKRKTSKQLEKNLSAQAVRFTIPATAPSTYTSYLCYKVNPHCTLPPSPTERIKVENIVCDKL